MLKPSEIEACSSARQCEEPRATAGMDLVRILNPVKESLPASAASAADRYPRTIGLPGDSGLVGG